MPENGKYYYKTANVDSNLYQKADMEHGAYNLAVNPEYYEVQRGNTFEFCVYDLNNITRAPGAANRYAVANAEEVIRLSVEAAFVPHFSQNPVQVQRGNTTINFAGVPTFSSGELTLQDYIGAGTLEALMAWQNCSFNVETEKVGLAKDYKKECTLTEYTPTWQPVRQWRLYGCWLSNLSETSFSYTNGDKHQITATITYDYAKLEEMSEVTT